MSGIGEPYTCANCGGTFEKGWSDEEAIAEARTLFRAEDLEEEPGIVCDGCFRQIMQWAATSAPEMLREPPADPIGDALRADAEAARAEIRAEGIACPSCGVNMADLPDGHALTLSTEAPLTAKCAGGTLASLAASSSPMSDGEFGKWQAAASIALWDDFRRREAEAFKRIIGEGPAQFTGLLGILEGGEQA